MLKLGNLESLKDAYACATLVINPVKFGTGIPVKTIEALGYGKPVVATPAGIRGIERDFDGAVLVAESEDAFAEQVLGLLASANARSAMSRNALIAVHEWQRRQLAALQAAVTGRPIPSEKSGFYAEKGASAPADA
jgi:glycosyltransferase involved in cell wall biosynthesis